MASNRFHRLLDKRSGQQNFLVELRVACVIAFSDSKFSTTVPQFRCLFKREAQVHTQPKIKQRFHTTNKKSGKIWTSLENVTITRFKAPELQIQKGQVACTHKWVLFAKHHDSGQPSSMKVVKCSLAVCAIYSHFRLWTPALEISADHFFRTLCKFSYLRDRSLT